MEMEMVIKLKESHEPPPYSLLLAADPSRNQVDSYLNAGECYLAWVGEELAGEIVLVRTGTDTSEIMNLAVEERFQAKGIAKRLIAFACERAREQGCTRIEVCTGNSSLNQLALYQKCGFRIYGVERDFFVNNYEEPLFENGIRCQDKIKLEQFL